MTTPPKPGDAGTKAQAPPCAWCGKPSVTEVITRKGRKLRKTAPVCDAHAEDFEKRGIATVSSEIEHKLQKELERKTWRARYSR